MHASFVHQGRAIDHIPSSDVAAGQVVKRGSLIGVSERPIPANHLGAIALEGVFDVAKTNAAIGDGVIVYWDEDGNPVDGEAGTGAVTTTASGNTKMGYTVGAAAEGAPTARVRLER